MYEDDANAVYIHDEMKNGFNRVNNILVIMTLLFLVTMILLICVFCRINAAVSLHWMKWLRCVNRFFAFVT